MRSSFISLAVVLAVLAGFTALVLKYRRDGRRRARAGPCVAGTHTWLSLGVDVAGRMDLVCQVCGDRRLYQAPPRIGTDHCVSFAAGVPCPYGKDHRCEESWNHLEPHRCLCGWTWPVV